MSADLYTNVTIEERNFSIMKFDARTGLKMARLLLAKIAPLLPYINADEGEENGANADEGEENGAKADEQKQEEAKAVKALAASFKVKMDKDNEQGLFSTVGVLLEKLDDDTIDYIIDKCLTHCFELLPAGQQPVLYPSGIYGVEGVKESITLTVRLCYEAIKWGASDFFGGKNSALLQKLKELGKQSNQ